MDRLVIHVSPRDIRFQIGDVEVKGIDAGSATPEEFAESVVDGFSAQGVDASAESASITQAIKDYRQSFP